MNTQPTDENCTVTNGSETVTGLVEVDVTITCIPASSEAVLYSFTGGGDGRLPSGLIQASDGNFYGTTEFGGANDRGTVFRLTPGGTETVLYSFAGGSSDGRNPQSGVIQASDGNFYGTTSAGGASDAGAVFKVSPAGAESVLYSFTKNGTDGYFPLYGVIQASDGNFYGTTVLGGINGDGTVFKVTPAGVETILYPFTGGADGQLPSSGLFQGGDGNFYGAFGMCCTQSQPVSMGGTQSPGLVTGGGVFDVTPAGVYSVLYSFDPSGIGGAAPGGVIQAGNGNFYGAASESAGNFNGVVFQLTPVQ